MKERPILFSAAMVRAILDGRKTQTRRMVKHGQVFRLVPGGDLSREERKAVYASPFQWDHSNQVHPTVDELLSCCPYGVPGDRLWVRETWAWSGTDKRITPSDPWYMATHYKGEDFGIRWRPSIHMPRWASRITLEVVSVRVERLQEISEADAISEGVQSVRDHYGDPSIPLMHCGTVAWQRYDGAACAAPSAQLSYQSLWESINGPGSWAANPWVWVVEFKRLEAQ